MTKSKAVIVVGGGAAGLMTAITAAENGAAVTIIEKNNRVGRKLMITGKGRCNLTNSCDVQTFINNVPTGGRFLYSAANAFPPADAMEFFESLGVPLKTERGGRVFPVSDRAVDVVDALRNRAVRAGCRIVTDRAEALIIKGGKLCGISCEGGNYEADSVIVCCGGKSYPLTGSTGDGYTLARQAGHTVITPKPSLVPLTSDDGVCRDMQGLSLKNAELKIKTRQGGKTVYSDFGEMLFTHFGMSGPMILSASAHLKNVNKGVYYAQINLKPALAPDKLDKRILRDFEEFHNRAVSNSLSKLLPRKLITPVLRRWGVPFEKKCSSVTREERQRLCGVLKAFTIDISGLRPIDEAIVTSGGVKTSELNPKTMESKLLNGLYFAGEVIDCDGYTGGFNLQIAWCTGRTAGKSAAAYQSSVRTNAK